MFKLLDIKEYVNTRKEELAKQVASMMQGPPHLLIIQIGDKEESNRYVKGKVKDCAEVGILTTVSKFSENIAYYQLKKYVLKIQDFYDGIIIQLPTPFTKREIDELIPIDKDVDGFINPNILSCTPKGIIDYLDFCKYDYKGKDILIINRSEIVGKPLILPLLDRDATVTIAHSKTKNLDEKIMRADLVVSAVGQANFITPGMVKPDAIIIDVGINFDENGKLVGDAAVPGQSTPVPGGVGLLTRLAVLENIISLTTGGNYYGSFS